jgi:hypothetical protein
MKKLALIIITGAFISGCSKSGTTAVTKAKTILDSVKNISGTRIWHGTHSENWPTIDTFYAVTDTFAIAVINDSNIIALGDSLKYYHTDSMNKAIIFLKVNNGLGSDYREVTYYYTADSIHYDYQSTPGMAYPGVIIHLKTP